jgi:hypothetical protein
MRVYRPFPKDLLKKMFLKVLYDNKKSLCECRDMNYISIICEILSEKLNVSQFTEQEFNEIISSVNELEKDGFIEQDDLAGSNKFKILTDKGTRYVESDLMNFESTEIEIDKYITRKDLKELCLGDFQEGHYETAILKAFRLIEDVSKQKSAGTSKFIEKENTSGLFISSDGVLHEAQKEPAIEPDSLHRMMLGVMKWFSNPTAQDIYNNSRTAAQVLLFVNMHLNILDQRKMLFNT